MLKKDLLEKIKDVKDDEDINSLLTGTDVETQFKGKEHTLDVFKQKIKTDTDFKKFMDTERDLHHSKALKTMKENGTWEGEFSDALKEKYPELVKDPMQLELMKERQAREQLEAKLAKKDLLAEATKYASEKGIKITSIDRYLGEDLDTTKANLDLLAEDWSKALEDVTKQESLEANENQNKYVYTPQGGNQDVDLAAQISGAINGNI